MSGSYSILFCIIILQLTTCTILKIEMYFYSDFYELYKFSIGNGGVYTRALLHDFSALKRICARHVHPVIAF